MILTPIPQQLTYTNADFTLEPGFIAINAPQPQALLFTARQLQQAVEEAAGVHLDIVAGNPAPEKARITLNIARHASRHPQGYELAIDAAGVHIVASQPAGVFYGVQTLRQILMQAGAALPGLRITDWPDFPNRGVLLDISRDRVPTMATLYDLIDLLASLKINQFQLYTEHTFAYRRHPLVWAQASPMTGEEILALDAYCRERFIELVPNQNTFGHMTRWLIHEPYAHLAEAPDGWTAPWGQRYHEPFTLIPNDESLALVRELLDELLPHFSSRQVNVNADETFDLGQGKSKALVEARGEGRVYLDFLLKIYREVKARERTMQFWGDIIVQHPDLVPQLPRDAIALEWGYEANHAFDAHGALFARSGIPFYVCPGTSSWRTLAGRTDNALGNLRNAAANGLKHGAIGYLNTDWGDEGHMQPLTVSYLGFLAGAAESWNHKAAEELDIPAALDAFIFRDEAGVMGRLAYDLGNAYQLLDPNSFNSSLFFNVLITPVEELARTGVGPGQGFSREQCNDILTAIGEIVEPLAQARMLRPDAELIQREFHWVAGMLWHACRRIAWANSIRAGEEDAALRETLGEEMDGLIRAYRELWLARSRPGGLQDSVARLERLQEEYRRDVTRA